MIDTGLNGRAVLVTGADGGIGAEIAAAFAEQGARVALHWFAGEPGEPGEPGCTAPAGADGGGPRTEHRPGSAADAARTVERLRGLGASGAAAVEGDLAGPEGGRAVLEAAEAALGGPVEVLVNNAAHCELPDDALSLTHGSLHRHYAVNVFTPAVLTAEVARRLPEGVPGAVVNISTDAARAFAGQLGYGTSKAALEAYTRAAALELGPRGVRVNAVAPGPVQTGWMTDALVREVVPRIPLRRVGEPRDIADAVVFLASAQARWITGQVVQVAGGHAL